MGKKKSHAEYVKERKALAAAYQDAGEIVTDILYSREAQDITLSLKGAHYDGASLRQLALLISNKKVLAFIVGNTKDLSAGSEAEYMQDIDTILLRNRPTSAYTKSAVIHECIHAINDMRKQDIENAANEKHAFIFQALYLRNLHVAGNIINAGGTQDIKFPPAAFKIADSLREGRSVSLDDVVHLEAALTGNTEYATHGKLAAKSPNDGVRQ